MFMLAKVNVLGYHYGLAYMMGTYKECYQHQVRNRLRQTSEIVEI